jgi:hypothetical protein
MMQKPISSPPMLLYNCILLCDPIDQRNAVLQIEFYYNVIEVIDIHYGDALPSLIMHLN